MKRFDDFGPATDHPHDPRNDRIRIRAEALDLAAALIRLHDGLTYDSAMAKRSGC